MVIYCDAATLADIERYASDERIAGFTTNPSLMRKAGITDYREFAKQVLERTNGKPVSFEVLADDFSTMERQAREIASWGDNVYVKVPVTNTLGVFCGPVITALAFSGVKVNVTAVMTGGQMYNVFSALHNDTPAIMSIFAGRIMDTGRKAWHMFVAAVRDRPSPKHQILWASPRQVFDVYEAQAAGADIITLTPPLIEKLALHGKTLEEYSLETVRMFHQDGKGIVL